MMTKMRPIGLMTLARGRNSKEFAETRGPVAGGRGRALALGGSTAMPVAGGAGARGSRQVPRRAPSMELGVRSVVVPDRVKDEGVPGWSSWGGGDRGGRASRSWRSQGGAPTVRRTALMGNSSGRLPLSASFTGAAAGNKRSAGAPDGWSGRPIGPRDAPRFTPAAGGPRRRPPLAQRRGAEQAPPPPRPRAGAAPCGRRTSPRALDVPRRGPARWPGARPRLRLAPPPAPRGPRPTAPSGPTTQEMPELVARTMARWTPPRHAREREHVVHLRARPVPRLVAHHDEEVHRLVTQGPA